MKRNGTIATRAAALAFGALMTMGAGAQGTLTMTHTGSGSLVASSAPGGFIVRRVADGAGASQGEGQSHPPAKDDLFAGADIFEKNATSVTDINMGPDSLGMVGGRHADEAHRMMLNTVKTYEYDQPGMFNMADVDKFRKKLDTGDWHCSVHERNFKTGESTDVCQKYRTDGYREDAIITVEKKELTFIHRIVKDGPDGHSYMVEPLMSSFDGMPAMAMLNTAKMDAAMAKMQALSAAHLSGLNGSMMILPYTKGTTVLPDYEIKLDQLNQIEVQPDMKISPDMQIKIQRFDGSAPPPAPPAAP